METMGEVDPVCEENDTAFRPGLHAISPGRMHCKLTCVTAAPGGMEYGLAFVTKPAHLSMTIMCPRRV